MEIFKLIAETGSFSMAAERLNLTQSALSHQMRALEEELGEQLLVRARPKIYATAAGQRVLVSAERIFTEIANVKAGFVNARKGEPKGSVRVASTHLAMTYVYGELLEQFSTRHPEVELVFHATETTEDPVQRVLQRQSDIGFTVLPVKHPQILTVPLFRAEQVLLVGRKHPLAKQKQTRVEELRRWPFARFETRTGGRQVSDSLFADGGYPPILAESNSVEYLKRIIRIAFGVALAPVFCARAELTNGTLHALRLRREPLLQEAGMIMRRDVHVRALDLFKDFCVQLRGAKLRNVTLENMEQSVFEAA